MSEKVKALLHNLNTMINFAKYNNILQNPQDSEFLWGVLETKYLKYTNKGITKEEIVTLEYLLERLNIEYEDDFKVWCRKEKIKGLL